MMKLLTTIKANKAYQLHSTGNQLLKLGDQQRGQKNLDKALEMYTQVYAEGNRSKRIMLGYSMILLRYGRFADADVILAELSKRQDLTREDQYQIQINTAISRWKTGDLDGALKAIRQANESGHSSVVYSIMGMFLIQKADQTNDFDEAAAFAAEALEYDDEDPSLLDNFAQLKYYMSLHETDPEKAAALRDEAMKWFSKAYEEKNDQVTTLFFLARIYYDLGDREHANDFIVKAAACSFSSMCQISRGDIDSLKGLIEAM